MKVPRYRDLRLFGKILLPFLALFVVIGVLGGVLIVRDLSTRAQTRLDRSLSDRALDARSSLRDRELYLIESVNFSANLDGIAERIRERDGVSVDRLLRSVLALKTDLNLVLAADDRGRALVQFSRSEAGARAIATGGRDWSRARAVARALADPDGEKHAGFVRVGGSRLLAMAGAICTGVKECEPSGVAVVGIDVTELTRIGPTGNEWDARSTGTALYDAGGSLLSSAGGIGPEPVPPVLDRDVPLRRTRMNGHVEVGTLYAPYEIQGRRAGTLAVSIPTEPVFSSVRGAGWRLAGIVGLAMLGAVALGTLLSRVILARVRTLLDTNRRLGLGELDARAPVLGRDELGELAHGVNQMADQLQASHETLELRVEQRTEEIRRLLKERTEFFAAMSHEFRTPLAIILREAELMQQPAYRRRKGWWRDTSRTLHESTGQVLGLVNDILDLARAEAGRMEVHLEDVRVQDVVAEVRRTIEGLARGSALRLGVHVPRDLPPARADRTRLRAVIINLVDNAVKYTPEGGSVDLSAVAANGCVRIDIRDSGVGIPPEAGDLVFEPFFRATGTKTQRGQASSGLGLALTRRLVEAMGGGITFTSASGRGSTFTVTLPSGGASMNGSSEAHVARG